MTAVNQIAPGQELPKLEWFEYEKFACRCGCGVNAMDIDVILELDVCRSILGFPIICTSGYRCFHHPDELKKPNREKARYAAHPTGHAIDLGISHRRADRFLELVYERKFFTGKGLRQKGRKRFVHVDNCANMDGIRPRPILWSY